MTKRNRQKDTPILIRLESPLHNAIRALAERKKVTLISIVREALDLWIKHGMVFVPDRPKVKRDTHLFIYPYEAQIETIKEAGFQVSPAIREALYRYLLFTASSEDEEKELLSPK